MIKKLFALMLVCAGLSYGNDSLIIEGYVFKDSSGVVVLDTFTELVNSAVIVKVYMTYAGQNILFENFTYAPVRKGKYHIALYKLQKTPPYSLIDPMPFRIDIAFHAYPLPSILCTLYQAGGPDKVIHRDIVNPHDSITVTIPVYDIMTKQKMNDVIINSHYVKGFNPCDTSIVSSKSVKVSSWAHKGYYVTATRDSFQSVSDTFFPYDSLWLARFDDTTWTKAASSLPYNQYTTDTLWMFRTIYPAPSIKNPIVSVSKQQSFVPVIYNIQGRVMRAERSGVMIQLMNGKVRRVVCLK